MEIFLHINDVQEGMREWILNNRIYGVKTIIKGQVDFLRELKKKRPELVVIGRWHWYPNVQEQMLDSGARNCAEAMWSRIVNDSCLPYVDYVEGLNEISGYPYRPNAGHERVLRYLEAERFFSDRVRDSGKKYLGGNWSTGHPDEQWYTDRYFMETVRDYYDAYGCHEYYAPTMRTAGHEGNVLRHKLLAQVLPDKPIYITECGCDSLAPQPHLTNTHQGYRGMNVAKEEIVADLRWYAQACAPSVRGFAVYCTGVQDETWRPFDLWNWGMSVLASAAEAVGTTVPTPPMPEVEVLPLTNAKFDGNFRYFNGVKELYVADGWNPFWASPPAKWYTDTVEHYDFRPEYKRCGDESNGPKRARSGFGQQWFNSYAGHRAGIYQRVNRYEDGTPIKVGDTVRFTAYMLSWHSQTDDPSISRDEDWMITNMYAKAIGIDPAGGTDWWGMPVVCSNFEVQNDLWIKFEVEATAAAEVVTLFLYGEPAYAFKNNNCYVDEVSLVKGAEPVTTPVFLPSNDAATVAAIINKDLGMMQDKIRWWSEHVTRLIDQADYCFTLLDYETGDQALKEALAVMRDLVNLEHGLLYEAERVAEGMSDATA